MIKFFKILEKIVWVLTIIAIVIVLGFIGIAFISHKETIWSYAEPIIPYIYIVAGIFVLFKLTIVGIQIYLDIQIQDKTKDLQAIIEKQRWQLQSQDEKMSGKLDKIINDISTIPKTDPEAIMELLKSNLPSVVSTLVEQQVALEKQKLTLEYEQKIAELKQKSQTVDALLEKHERLNKLKEALKEKEQIESNARLERIEEYTSLFFGMVGTSVEDVGKVEMVVKLFAEHGHVPAYRDLKIAYNKNLRNAELKQFVINILHYNQKENYDYVNFLMTYFCDWFTGKRENILKNYNVLPKDSLISKEGLEADLERLRKAHSVKEC